MATNWVAEVLARFGPDAPDDDERILVYTLAGTGSMNPWTGDANFPIQVANLLDDSKFQVSPIVYPAAFPFGWSVNQGITNCRSVIRRNKGRKFVIVAFSQGAMVASQIRKDIRSGVLQDFDDDFLGAVFMGNPCRMANFSFPGYTRANHGIADAAHRLTVAQADDTRLWEMSIPTDLASDVGDDTTGRWLTALFMAAWNSVNPIPAIAATVKASPVDLKAMIPEFLAYFGLTQIGGAAHTQYDTYVPATIDGDPNTKTMVQLAADYISSLADD